jgi:hypothetical protein
LLSAIAYTIFFSIAHTLFLKSLIERYLGADLVQFRIQEAAEQLMREGRSVHAMADEHSFHVDQTGTVYHGIQWQ